MTLARNPFSIPATNMRATKLVGTPPFVAAIKAGKRFAGISEWTPADAARRAAEMAKKQPKRKLATKSVVPKRTPVATDAVVATTKSQLSALRAEQGQLKKQLADLEKLASQRAKKRQGIASKVKFAKPSVERFSIGEALTGKKAPAKPKSVSFGAALRASRSK